MTRRERLERIAMAERDRRAGRVDVAVATLGEANEWPARVVLALSRLSESRPDLASQVLEEGLDLWVDEVGLDPLDVDLTTTPSIDMLGPAESALLDEPIEQNELERAFEDAEAQTDEMHDVNSVAERVLMDEPVGLAEMTDHAFSMVDASDEPDAPWAAAFEVEAEAEAEADEEDVMDAAVVPTISPAFESIERARTDERDDSRTPPSVVLATLSRWLTNLEESSARRPR